MLRAVEIVRANPGCSKLFVGKRLHVACATGKNNAFGYGPVNRAIQAGLIIASGGPRNAYSLTVAE